MKDVDENQSRGFKRCQGFKIEERMIEDEMTRMKNLDEAEEEDVNQKFECQEERGERKTMNFMSHEP